MTSGRFRVATLSIRTEVRSTAVPQGTSFEVETIGSSLLESSPGVSATHVHAPPMSPIAPVELLPAAGRSTTPDNHVPVTTATTESIVRTPSLRRP